MRAIEIRIRAERRCGELLAEMERAQGKRSDLATSVQADAKSFGEQLDPYGISQTQSSRWQKLAEVPEAEFEATFARSEKPSTTGINRGSSEKKRDVVDANALWFWGRLLDFERDGLLGADPEEICATIFLRQRLPQAHRRQYHRHPNCPRPRRLGPLRRSIDRPRKEDPRVGGGAGRSDRAALSRSRASPTPSPPIKWSAPMRTSARSGCSFTRNAPTSNSTSISTRCPLMTGVMRPPRYARP